MINLQGFYSYHHLKMRKGSETKVKLKSSNIICGKSSNMCLFKWKTNPTFTWRKVMKRPFDRAMTLQKTSLEYITPSQK